MPSASREIRIEAPPDVVFPYLLDVDKRLRWVTGLESSVPVDADEPRVGSRFREVVSQAGLRIPVETTVTRLEPARGVELSVDGRGFAATTATTLEPADGGTRLVSTIDARVGGLAGRFVGPMVGRQLETSLERSLADLKRLVESESR